MQLVGKLTPKSLGWDRAAIALATAPFRDDKGEVTNPNGKVRLGRFVGIVAGLRQTVDADTGDIQTGLKGNFRGISTKEADGKPIVVTSGVCYLPAGIQDMVEGALATAREADGKATVQFAIDLFGIAATNKAGYSFMADNIVAPATADPLALLLEQAAGNSALPAPEGEAPTGDAPTGDEPTGDAPTGDAPTGDAPADPAPKGGKAK